MSEANPWPALTEVECAARIIEAMAQDLEPMELAIAPSKRSTRFQRALDSLKERREAALQCLQVKAEMPA